MEQQLIKLNNHLSRKRIEYIEISGMVNTDGTLKQRFQETFNFNEDNDYHVSLLSAEMSSFFPNITTNVNNKFYYSGPDSQQKEISLDEGAYDVSDISKIVQYHSNENIKIEIEAGSGKSLIFLKPGYKVYLRAQSFSTILGYPIVGGEQAEFELKDPINKSPQMCSVIKTNKIYISLDIIEGSYFNGNKSRILYSFPNKEDFGYPIYIEPRFQQKKKLIRKQFIDMTFTFTNENGDAIDFMKTPVSLTLEICEV